MKKRLVIAISGSSGPIYGIRLLEVLSRNKEIETHLILSKSAELTIELEAHGWSVPKVKKLAHHVHDSDNLAASISSGSFHTYGMVVIPCSMKTLANIAHGTGSDLMGRAADVTLKERRKLILVTRETPLHLGHLRNMVSVTEMGGIILPPIPAFYHNPKTIDDVVNHTIGKLLDLLGFENDLFQRWSSSSHKLRAASRK
jgi:flavin prenyltransferase